MENLLKNKYLFTLVLLNLILHIVSSFNSIGFYSDDEHFQILEITAYLLGINDVAINDPTGHYWEWEENIRMRPWIQPYIYFGLINFLKYFVQDNPFYWALYLRIVSSFIGFLSIIYLFIVFKNIFFQNNKFFNYSLFFTFWFYPFLHSRTSSENLSISLFVISFCILYEIFVSKKYNYNFLLLTLGSFLMGLSMVFKFTMVFTAIPFFLWILLFRFNFIRLTIFGCFILIALSLGLYIDFINWGSFKNTYWQFYIHNLSFGEVGRMKYFGTDPWFYYFTEIIKQLAPLLSLFFLIGLIYFWIRNIKNIFTFITLITFIVFSIIGHKEIRYIFPIYILAPFFIAYFLEGIKISYLKNSFKFIIIFSNIVFLLITLFTPANSKVDVYKFIYKNLSQDDIIYYVDENPYLVNNMEAKFYTNFLPKIKKIDKTLNSNKWITTNKFQEVQFYLNKGCKIEYSTYPKKIIDLNKNWRRLKLNWYIIYCE